MTPDDVKKIRSDMRPGHHILTDDVVEAIDWLADALREAQAAVGQMREDAAKHCEDQWCPGLAKAIRALPAPAARTYDDGVRAALATVRSEPIMPGPMPDEVLSRFNAAVDRSGGIAEPLRAIAASTRDSIAARVEALLSPAPAVATVAGWRNLADGTVASGPNMPSFVAPVDASKPRWIVAPPIDFSAEDAPDEKPVAFDAEAALVEMQDSIARRGMGSNPATLYQVYTAVQDALAAGRGAR